MIPANHFGVLECDRNTEFAPVRNSERDKVFTPSIARTMLLTECGSWISQTPKKISNVEVSPLFSYEGEGMTDL